MERPAIGTFEKKPLMPCFFKTISTFAIGQRKKMPFLEFHFLISPVNILRILR